MRSRLTQWLSLCCATVSLHADEGPVEGLAQPFRTVTVSASLREVIEKITPEEGDRVKAGDLLVELESVKEALSVERLEQMLEKAKFDAAAAKRLFEQNVSS
jgi:membrane fusion protein, multidrug efflux system